MTLKAPNGNVSNLTPEQYVLVRTDAFKAWFGDWERLAMAKLKDAAMDEVTMNNLSKDVSKIVDENGEPLVVYHTVKERYNGFTKFRTVNDGNEIGSHFGTKEQAIHVANNALVENPKMFECFLNVKNPLQVDDMGFWTASNYEFVFRQKKIPYNKSKTEYQQTVITVQDVFDALKEQQIDGLVYRNIYEGSGFSYIVYYPNQIKLADGTNTTFDIDNHDIRFNDGGTVQMSSKQVSAIYKANGFETRPNGLMIKDGVEIILMTNQVYEVINDQPIVYNAFANENVDVIELISISNKKNRSQGAASKVLDEIIQISDKYNRVLQLYPQPLQGSSLDKIQLTQWYMRKGFVMREDGVMVKEPNQDIIFNNGGKMKSVSKGTITVGASHEEGGIQVYNKGTGQMLEVEGGEGIINKRSMALNEKVTFNGEKMTPCEAASEINQMAGGVAYNCDNVEVSKEKYNNGGEFRKGLSNRISDEYTPIRRKPTKCSCSKRYYDGGGEFDSGIGSLDSFVNSRTPTGLKNAEDQEIIDYTISTGREMLDADILPIILKNIDAKWKPYFSTYKTFNLYQLGWRIQFGSSRQWAGLCSWDGELSKNIYVSIQFVKHDRNWKDNAIDTIQHEIAHACVTEAIISKLGQPAFKMIDPLYFANTGHGESWKSICNAINPDGDCSVFYTNSKMKESFRPYKYECVNCGNKGYGNKLGFTSNCFKCFRPVVTSKNLV